MNHIAQDLFTRALELPESEREAFLTESCGGDAELGIAVQRMLVDSERAGSSFGGDDDSLMAMVGKHLEAARESGELDVTVPPEAAGVLDSLRSEEEGEMIGPYKLLQEIGVGGFGSVWMAEQSKPISRRVALKVIKMGMDTREVIARFEQERQALAMMDHPNIAMVLDAGATDRGRPFFVMELVKGIPITNYCDEAGLGTTERLALFGDVCSAINHAHQKGIIHRDIKPSNVMVTIQGDKPVVKVIDFGIAKATQGKLTDQTLFTRFDEFIGTPVYMSPEQAAMSGLDIDTRSDIYALGILLYELLVGKPPFDSKTLVSAGYDEMRRIIREVEPPKPSSRLSTIAGAERTLLAKTHKVEEAKLNKLVEPDLDWIVMKAIDKERTRRYETANAFAQDIERFLADEPVTATPPSASYQFRKFAKRNKAALRVAAAIFAVMVAATVVSSWQAVRATRAEAKASQETKRVSETLALVAAERDAKEAALEDAEAVSDYLVEAFRSPDPEMDGRDITMASILAQAVERLREDKAMEEDRKITLTRALAQTSEGLGLLKESQPLWESVRDYCAKTFGEGHIKTIQARLRVSSLYRKLGHYEEAYEEAESAVAAAAVFGETDIESIRARQCLATAYWDGGRLEEALIMREQILKEMEERLGPDNRETLTALNHLAVSYRDSGRTEKAVALMERGHEMSSKMFGENHPRAISTELNLGAVYGDLGRHEDAIATYEKAYERSLEVLGEEHPTTLNISYNLATQYWQTKRLDEALALREKDRVVRQRVLGDEHPSTLKALTNLAVSYAYAKRMEEAIALEEKTLKVKRRVLGEDDENTQIALSNLALWLSNSDQIEKALPAMEESYADRCRLYGDRDRRSISMGGNLMKLYRKMGRLDDARDLGEKVLERARSTQDPKNSTSVWLLGEMVNIHHARKEPLLELKYQKERWQLRREILGQQDKGDLGMMTNLSIELLKADHLKEATALQEEALALKRTLLEPSHPWMKVAIANLAACYDSAGRGAEAAKLREELEALKAKQ